MGELLLQFQNNNKKFCKQENQVNQSRIEENKKILNDLNTIVANLSQIEDKSLKNQQIQSALQRSFEDMEITLRREIELNQQKQQAISNEVSDLQKILDDLQKIKLKLCIQNQNSFGMKL